MNFNAFEPGVLIYTFFLFLLLLTTGARYNKTNKENLPVFIFFIILQILIGGLRCYNVGTDTLSYLYTIRHLSSYSIHEIILARGGRDPYFFVFTKLITDICDSYTFLFFVLQIIWWSLVSFIIYKQSKSCLLSLLILVAFRTNYFALAAMRQGMAVALVVFSFNFLEKRDFKKYMVVIALAVLCHKSALVFVPVYFINRLYINRISVVFGLMLISLALAYILPDIEFEEDFAYLPYIQSGDMANFFSFVITAISFLFIMYNVANKKMDSVNNMLFTLSLIAVMFSLMGTNLRIAYRMAEYFSPFMTLLMANIIMGSKSRSNMVPALLIIIFVIYIVTGMPVGLNEYQFCWEAEPFLFSF